MRLPELFHLHLHDIYTELGTAGIGQSSLVEVERGVVGSTATSHSAGNEVRVYKGSYNISGRNIHFVDPPKGNTSVKKDVSNLEPAKSDFTGRVYLRNNYDTNQIYDDISDQFTGIGATFTLTVGGANTTGIGSTGGNGILFINGIFQTPSTLNNPDNNFSLNDEGTVGVTSVTFSGITSTDGTKYLSNIDYNANQLPRGGVIVSLGSSGGFGYAPLLGAEVTGQSIDRGILAASVVGNSINSIDVLQSPKGLPDKSTGLFTVENTNGISIQRVIQETDTRFVCRITTPALGFSTSSFSVGEKVFIEGIQKVGVAGSGFNSEDYGYKFFTVTEYKNSKFVGIENKDLNIYGLQFHPEVVHTIQGSKWIEESLCRK